MEREYRSRRKKASPVFYSWRALSQGRLGAADFDMAVHEQWSTGKKYLNMTEYHEWKKQQESSKSSPTLAIVE